jgi:peptidoglycan/xylan/chitin deacetylase (PgdA/CDA1 family)
MINGKFIISLDFELHWGVAEIWELNSKKEYFDTTRKSIPLVLEMFKQNNIHATWATVGFLFAKDKNQLISFCPKLRPTYVKSNLSYYNLIDDNLIGENEIEDPYHYAPSLINLIINTPNQEIGTHTFSHYYCNEKGQNEMQFEEDLKAAVAIAKENFDIKIKSLVFPRNQFNKEYLEIAKQNGIVVVRSNPNVWFWKNDLGKLNSIFRAIDTLFPISKSLTFKSTNNSNLLLPASRFLRPYVLKERFTHKLKISRIKSEMTYAAKKGNCYHLWWHPHNFGNCLDENMKMLKEIIVHYKYLNEKYNFESCNMRSFILK